MPNWLTMNPTPQSWQLSDVKDGAMALADRLENEIGHTKNVLGAALTCTEYELAGGAKLALIA